jgi:hypothetical protein
MSTYIISSEIQLIRQEGDTSDIVFVVPDVLSLTTFTEIKFSVFRNSSVIIEKLLSDGSISVLSQTITIDLLPDDTKGYSGDYKWELEISNLTPTIITIGRGMFTLIAEQIA